MLPVVFGVARPDCEVKFDLMYPIVRKGWQSRPTLMDIIGLTQWSVRSGVFGN